MNILNLFIPIIEHLGVFSYWIILFVSLIESLAFVGVVVPGTAFIVIVGFMSSQGFLDIGDVILFAIIGAFIGDAISYYWGGHAKKLFHNDNKFFKLRYLQHGEKFFRAHGGKSLFADRFIGPVRPIMPFVAGLMKMNKAKFIILDILSSIAWAVVFVSLGFIFGQAWELVMQWSTRIGIFAVGTILLLIIFYILLKPVIRNGQKAWAVFVTLLVSTKETFLQNDDVRSFIKKHSSSFQFLQARFSKKKFSGLPLSLLTLAFIYILFLFAGIIEDIITLDPIVAVDTHIANLLVVFRNMDLINIFLWITMFGKWQIVIGFILFVTGILWLWHKRTYILPLLFTIIGSEAVVKFGKLVFHRLRPAGAVYIKDSFSFPSGHATISIAFYGFLIYMLVRNTEKYWIKVVTWMVGISTVLLIGLSRIYLGVHYLSDVWGGYLIGMMWLIIGISIVEWLQSRKEMSLGAKLDRPTHPDRPTRKVYLASATILVVMVLFYIKSVEILRPTLVMPAKAKITNVQDVQEIFKDKSLYYTETLLGTKNIPLSFVVKARDDRELISTMQKAKWFLADKLTLATLVQLIREALVGEVYLSAPVKTSFWNTDVNNFAFEKLTDHDVNRRHYVKFWRTNFKTIDGNNIYVGTTSLGVNTKWKVLHKIMADVDSEREFLYQDLKQTQLVHASSKEKFIRGDVVNTAKYFGDHTFFSDGEMYVIDLGR